MSTRTLKLSQDHEYVITRQNSIANVRSTILEVAPPAGTYLGIARRLALVMKLVTTGGAQVAGRTRIFFGKRRPGDTSISYLPGAVDFHVYRDLTTVQQRNVENLPTVTADLGQALALREDELLIVAAEGPTLIDVSEAGFVFEFDAGYQNN